MQYIYSRVSTERQDNENQLSRLRDLYPQAIVFEETASGIKARPILQRLYEILQKGDELIVAELSRLGRRTSQVLTMVEALDKRGVVLKSLRESLDLATPAGRLMLGVICSVAQMEREMLSVRTKAALDAKRRQGIKLGAPAKYSAETVERVRNLKAQGMTCREVAGLTGVSASRVSQLTKKINCIPGDALAG